MTREGGEASGRDRGAIALTVRKKWRKSVCVFEREKERECVCVCERERERETTTTDGQMKTKKNRRKSQSYNIPEKT